MLFLSQELLNNFGPGWQADFSCLLYLRGVKFLKILFRSGLQKTNITIPEFEVATPTLSTCPLYI
jgi:hypothetical protein